MKLVTVVLLLLGAFTASAGLAQDAPANLVDGCIETFDPSADYFPEKMTVEYAEGFTLEYHNSYKVVRVTRPWQGAEVTFDYVLVQCGAPTPDDLPEDLQDAVIVSVPVRTAVTMSTTQIPHFAALDLIDRIVAHDEFDFVYSPELRERIDAGEVAEVGGGAFVDVEAVLNLEPDVVMTYGIGSPDYDAHPVLINAGLVVALNSDYMETSPLGRAEWIKFTAAFFNREVEANEIFDGVVERYEALKALAAEVEDQPTVLVNALFGDTWFVAGGNSYIARLIEDAGGDYLWADDTSSGGLPLSFEAVLDRAQDADVWLNPNFWFTLADGLAEDERYAEFAAFQAGAVYNNNARVTPLGGNDYGETGVLYPDLVLADLIAIFHPDLMPDHELYFYRQLE